MIGTVLAQVSLQVPDNKNGRKLRDRLGKLRDQVKRIQITLEQTGGLKSNERGEYEDLETQVKNVLTGAHGSVGDSVLELMAQTERVFSSFAKLRELLDTDTEFIELVEEDLIDKARFEKQVTERFFAELEAQSSTIDEDFVKQMFRQAIGDYNA